MAGKQILGDDPFASGDEEPAAVSEAAEIAEAAPAAARKRAGKDAKEAKDSNGGSKDANGGSKDANGGAKRSNGGSKAASVSAGPAAAAAPAAELPVAAAPAAAASAAPSTAAAAPVTGEVAPALETYSAVEPARASEYGPSIDRPPASTQRHGVLDEVRQIERSVRDRLLPERSGEHGGERQRLPLEFLWQRWRKLAMRDRSDVVDEFGRDPQVAARVDPLLDFFYRTYFRVETRGLGHIPDEGRGLIVANHSGTLPYDGAMIMHAVRTEHRSQREVRPLVEDFVFHFPYLGTLMNRIGGVRACPENAERLLQQDQLVAVFPEGIKGISKLYRERYHLQRFGRGGFIKLALKSDAPIIPTAVVGAEEVHPMLSKVTWLAKSVGIPYIPVTPTFPFLGPIGLVPLPTKWFIAFGEPLYFNAEYGADGANDRILVNKLAEQVRARIQEMIDGLLRTRRSVLFG
jgi:1-acyl-sn-glycerol-3-phosphate acyltransferase